MTKPTFIEARKCDVDEHLVVASEEVRRLIEHECAITAHVAVLSCACESVVNHAKFHLTVVCYPALYDAFVVATSFVRALVVAECCLVRTRRRVRCPVIVGFDNVIIVQSRVVRVR